MTKDEYADLVRRVVAATSGYSTREAGDLVGVSHTKIDELRKWVSGDRDLASPKNATVRKLRGFLDVADSLESRRAGLLYAADREDTYAVWATNDLELMGFVLSVNPAARIYSGIPDRSSRYGPYRMSEPGADAALRCARGEEPSPSTDPW